MDFYEVLLRETPSEFRAELEQERAELEIK